MRLGNQPHVSQFLIASSEMLEQQIGRGLFPNPAEWRHRLEYQGNIRRRLGENTANFVQFFDEDHSSVPEVLDHRFVVDDLLADIKRGPVGLEQAIDDLLILGLFGQSWFIFQSFFNTDRFDTFDRNHLRQPVNLTIGHLKYPTDIAN